MIMRYGWFPFDGVIGLALLVAIVAIAIVIVVAAMQRRDGRHHDEADAILRSRLARGEISVEEYEKARQALGLK
ncbi:MAG: SHOCT domain-containing protein [Candidatus Limnocylindrales bacterium]